MRPPSLAALLACLAWPRPIAQAVRLRRTDAATTSATDAPPAGAAKSAGKIPTRSSSTVLRNEDQRGEAAASAEWRGTTYWFCLADHRDAFLADPQRCLCRPAGGDAGWCDGR